MAWLDKVYKSVVISSELRVLTLAHNANKDAPLNEQKKYFAPWDKSVIIFLLEAVMPTEVPQQPRITAESMHSAVQAAEAKRELDILMAQLGESRQKVEEEEDKFREVRGKLDQKHLELEHVTSLVAPRQTSWLSSRRTSRAVSPTGSQRTVKTLNKTVERLGGQLAANRLERETPGEQYY